MQQDIRLYKGADSWIAEFVGNDEIADLFGTTHIPTPYTLHSRALTVLKAIEDRNPGCNVYIETKDL